MFHKMIEKAVHKSQHCQRNWDLTKEVPERDLQVMETAVTQCPSKQNYAYYKPYLITNREIIQSIYNETDGFIINFETGESKKNPQVLANVLVAFVEDDEWRRIDSRELNAREAKDNGTEHYEIHRQRNISIGIAAGYLNLSSTLMGYSTGCCTCFDEPKVRSILGTNRTVHLLMGVGFADEDRSRRIQHDDPDFTFPTFSKNIEAVRVA